MKTHLSFPALAAACLLIQNASASSLPADVLFHEDFENPDVPSYSQGITPDIWVRSAGGFGSSDHGMTDKSGGDFSAPAGNEQAYAFRYSNSGLTTKEMALGSPLAFGGGYEVSFDVVKDNSNGGKAYSVRLIAFGADANGDGMDNGLAFLLGASGPNAAVTLPTVSHSSGNLVLTFNMRNSASRGSATLNVQHSSDLGISDAWQAALVPDTDTTVNDVVYDITEGSPTNGVQATIPSGKAASGKLFGRLKGQP